jgi:tetratricopeptide (TPR) repeat protein
LEKILIGPKNLTFTMIKNIFKTKRIFSTNKKNIYNKFFNNKSIFQNSNKEINYSDLNTRQETSETLIKIAEYYKLNNEYHKTKIFLQEGLKILEIQNGKGHLNNEPTIYSLGETCYIMGDMELTIKYIENSYQILQQVHGKESKKLLNHLNMLSKAYYSNKDYKKSEENCLELIKLNANMGIGEAESGDAYSCLAHLYFYQENYAESKKYYEKILNLHKILQKDPKIIVKILQDIIVVCKYLKDEEQAQKYIDELKEVMKVNGIEEEKN